MDLSAPVARRVLVMDNYDSFTLNLAHLVAGITGRMPDVLANDDPALTPSLLHGPLAPEALIISPGPGHPSKPADVGACPNMLAAAIEAGIPVLGVCLGHQLIAEFFGGKVVHAPQPRHGVLSPIHHDGSGIFAGLEQDFPAVRYHSLAVSPSSLTDALTVTAHSEDGVIQGLRHSELPVYGVQFHPESIATGQAEALIANFLRTASPNPRVIRSRSVAFDGDDAAVFDRLYGHKPNAVWLDGNLSGHAAGRFSILGAGDEVIHHDLDAVAEELAATPVVMESGEDVPFDFALGFVGALPYESGAGSKARPSWLWLERAVVIDHDLARAYVLSMEDDPSSWFDDAAHILATVGSLAVPPLKADVELTVRNHREDYLGMINAAQEAITDGETYEICLTTALEGTGEIDPWIAYLHLRAANPAGYGAFLRFGDTCVLSTSPELFLSVSPGGKLTSSPIKGTSARRSGDDDEAVTAELAASEKDRAENLMIVDLTRHDLGRVAVAGSVAVTELFGIHSFATVHQMISTVTAQLRPECSPIEAVRAAFPPGSMTGAPKKRTTEIINELESGPRGIYSGAIGYLSPNGAVKLSVVIRTLVCTPGRLHYGVGGAVVALSDPVDEHHEITVKAAPLLRLLNQDFPA